MTGFYAITRYLTLLGSLLRAFVEQLICRMNKIAVEDNRYLRFNEMCSHVEHELPKDVYKAAAVAYYPFVWLLLFGFFITVPGAAHVLLAGNFSIFPLVSLWIGVSLLCNLFPTVEDAMNLRGLAEETGKFKFLSKFMMFGAKFESTGLTVLTSLAAAVIAALLFMLF